jgi:hypothetical protein
MKELLGIKEDEKQKEREKTTYVGTDCGPYVEGLVH